MVIYLEWVVIINFLVDFLLLYGTNQLSGFSGGGKRAALGAFLGSIYAGACVLPDLAFLAGGFWRLISFGIMSAAAFGVDKSALRRGILFFLLSMALGGLATGFAGAGVWTLVLSAALMWLLCLLGFGGGKSHQHYASVTVTHRGKTLRLTALVDTGNTLRDPISHRPVLVADAAVAQKLLGLSIEALEHPLETLAAGSCPGLRLIPYSSVGNPAGMLLAVKAERVEIDGAQKDVLIGFAPQRIGQGKAFEALAGGTL